MQKDIIFITGEKFFDHPLCGIAILKRLLEEKGFSVGIIEQPTNSEDITKLGAPNLFFGITSGSIDSMVINYTPLKKKRDEDKHAKYSDQIKIPDRAVIVYSSWIKEKFKESKLVLGGTEASLRRFAYYDYWDNKLRKPILFDTRADLLCYGNSEKQIVEAALRIKSGDNIQGIEGTCIISHTVPADFKEMPSYDEVVESKESFCKMQNMLSNVNNLCQKIDNRYMLQYKAPTYTSKDLDHYFSFPFKRDVPKKLEGFRFSIVTHRGCIGECNFCSVNLMQGSRIISRSEKSILDEVKRITKMNSFKGNIDDLGGPSANMYGMDCGMCVNGSCIDCNKLDRSNSKLIHLMIKIREISGVKKVIIRSGIKYDLATEDYIKEVAEFHVLDTLRIAPEHVNKDVLKLMNKDKGNLNKFITMFNKFANGRKLSFYLMTAHPGSGMNEAKELAEYVREMKNCDSVQVFTPTPMSVSTCMYYTSIDPKTMKKIYVPYTYKEKKEQKRVIMNSVKG